MAVLFTGCIGRSCYAPGLLDLIELGIHFQQLLFGEGDIPHSQHSGEPQDGEAADHLHHIGNHVRVLALLLFLTVGFGGGSAHLLCEGQKQPRKPELAPEGFGNLAQLAVEAVATLDLGDVEPVENRALLPEDIVGVHGVHLADDAFIPQAARNSFQLRFTAVGHIKIEEMILRRFFAQADTIGEQLHLGKIGIDSDFGHILHPVDVALAAEVDHVGILSAIHGDLVGKTPDHDGGVVIALGDQFLHLADGVAVGIGHVAGDVGDLRPDHHAALVAEVIEILVVLVVGQTDGVGTHLTDEIHILQMVLLQQGITDSPPILMTADTPQGILPSVQNKAPLRMNLKAAAAKPGGDSVQRFAVSQNHGFGGVELPVHPVPQGVRMHADGICE